MSNDLKWMLSSDQQFPYQDDKMIELWFKVMKWFKPDVVDYLGDTDDQACYSKYTEGRSAEFLNLYKTDSADLIIPTMRHEAKGARDFYAKTREMLPDAQGSWPRLEGKSSSCGGSAEKANRRAARLCMAGRGTPAGSS